MLRRVPSVWEIVNKFSLFLIKILNKYLRNIWWILFQLVMFVNFKKYFNIFIIKMYYLIVLISSVVNFLTLMLSFSCYSSLIQVCKICLLYQSFLKNLLLVIFMKPFSLLFSTPLSFMFISIFNCFYFLILKSRWIPLFSVPLNLRLSIFSFLNLL